MSATVKTPSRIALFVPSFERGGVERTVVRLAKGFVASGYQVDLVTARAEQVFLDQMPPQARIVEIGRSRKSLSLPSLVSERVGVSLGALPGLVRYLRCNRPLALISAQSSVVAVWARALAHTQVRLIVRESNTPSVSAQQDRRVASRLMPTLKRWAYPRADAIVSNSQDAGEDLARVLRLPPNRITIIYNPTFDDDILPQSKEPVEHHWFNADQPPVVLGVGRLTAQKDFETLIRAFHLVHQRLPARLVILGDGPERASLESLARHLRIGGHVELLGFVDNPYKYMSRASLFVLSSRYEGMPNVLIEALALGVPSVSTDCPSGPREIFMDSSFSPLVPVGDVEALAMQMLGLLSDRKRARQLVEEAQPYLKRFRPETCIRQYLSLVEGGC